MQRVNVFHCRSDRRYMKTKWNDLRVGDFVHLSCNEAIPADIVLLRSSDEFGVCRIDTSNLDGENNLKQRIVTKDVPQVNYLWCVPIKECKVIIQN